MNIAAIKARFNANKKKQNARRAKAASHRIAGVKALPAVPQVFLNANYINPVTLDFPKGIIIYEIQNRRTGRKNYYDRQTFYKLMRMLKSDYDLLMRNPKVPIPGARNPVTRGPIYPRNIRRVTVKPKRKTPTRSAAANKIKKAIKKHISRKSR
jgi:hypothetical protein